MKKFLIFLALLGGAAFSLLLNPSIKAKAANFWDSHIIIGGMNTTNGVPLKVDADGVVYTTGGSAGTPGGSDTQVQFNDGGSAFGGDAGMTYNKTTNVLTVGSIVTDASDGSNKILMSNNTSISPTASSDEIYFEGNVFKVNENGTEKTVIDSSSTVDALATSTSANVATLLSDESGTDKVAFTTSPVFTTPNIGVATATGNMLGLPHTWHISIPNPNTTIPSTSLIIPIWSATDAAITITSVKVTTSSASYEVAGDLKWADDRISLANAAVIETFDTTSGVRVDTSIASASVASGKCVYLLFDAAPNAAMKDVVIDIGWHY